MVIPMKDTKISKHYNYKRGKRERFIRKYFGDDGDVVESFIIDKGHKHGPERHEVTENGVILIYNANSNILVTKKIARPKQIEELYSTKNKAPPKWLLDIAEWHESMNMNYI